ncbi:MAG TPA: UDP-N-acetylglucosamine 2-epimerase [Burkholderiales bacterium]|nr:UDP-N-acetylglucosamine 2-epimerase [Burkholderiales bacterium]
MFTCFVGTRAQLIKMAPVILEIEKRGLPFNLVFTGQHEETMEQLLNDFGIHAARSYLYRGKEITGIVQMGSWFVRCLWKCLRESDKFVPGPSASSVMLVHGDTFSTLLGAIVGKLKGITVAHIEAGLRSGNIFHPFPEELTRRAVFRLSDLAFCPGAWPYDNMKKYRAKRIDTGQNTLLDTLAIALAVPQKSAPPYPMNTYGIVSLHRFENIFYVRRLAQIINLLETAAVRFPLVFVLHPATRKKLAQFDLLSKLESNPRIKLLPRMGYIEFVKLMQGAKFVITDGGSNQEELSYLGIPTLLMRKATERQEGLETTATLCPYDEKILERFMRDLADAPTVIPAIGSSSPSEMIVNQLESYVQTRRDSHS